MMKLFDFVKSQWGVIPQCRQCGKTDVKFVCSETSLLYCGKQCQQLLYYIAGRDDVIPKKEGLKKNWKGRMKL